MSLMLPKVDIAFKLLFGDRRSKHILAEMRSRISYYLSNMITEQIGMGGHYSELKQAVSIVITDYDFIPETGRCHTVFRMLEAEEHFEFNGLMEINVLNLEKLPAEDDSKLGNWLRFL
ncbi:MAG: Rpn family recombination-promoting nuclease/putative transposase, partial [Treponema sp.]|nr:Rpn family recombination-promoting nuclease/putative transposase [Treponema sp.]